MSELVDEMIRRLVGMGRGDLGPLGVASAVLSDPRIQERVRGLPSMFLEQAPLLAPGPGEAAALFPLLGVVKTPRVFGLIKGGKSLAPKAQKTWQEIVKEVPSSGDVFDDYVRQAEAVRAGSPRSEATERMSGLRLIQTLRGFADDLEGWARAAARLERHDSGKDSLQHAYRLIDDQTAWENKIRDGISKALGLPIESEHVEKIWRAISKFSNDPRGLPTPGIASGRLRSNEVEGLANAVREVLVDRDMSALNRQAMDEFVAGLRRSDAERKLPVKPLTVVPKKD